MSKKIRHLNIVLALGILLFSFAYTMGQEKVSVKLPDELVEAVRSNTNDIDPISMAWKRTRRSELKTNTLLSHIRSSGDYAFLEPHISEFMWQKGMVYHRYLVHNFMGDEQDMASMSKGVYKKKLKLSQSYSERSFNGGNYYNGSRSDAVGYDLGIEPLRKTRNEMIGPSAICQFYTTFIGYKFPNCGTELGMSHQSYVTFLADRGKIIDVTDGLLDGKKVVIVRIQAVSLLDWNQTERLFTFWLLPRYNYAIKKYDISSLDGEVAYSIENDDFVQVSGKSVYLPRKTLVKYYTYSTVSNKIFSSPLFEEIYQLTEISTKKIAEKQFDISDKYNTPGTCISDYTFMEKPDGVSYVVPANPADLDRVIEAALKGGNFVPTSLPLTSVSPVIVTIVRWLLCIAGIAMILYAGYIKFIKR